MTSNQINYWAGKERERSNKVNERETKRHNKASEGIERARIGVMQAQVDLGRAQLEESKRQADMSFIINKANSLTRAEEAAISSQHLDETKRHNEATEKLNELIAKADFTIKRFRANTEYTAQQYTNALNEAKRKLTVTQGQKEQLDLALAPIDKAVDTVTSVLNSVSKAIDALVPF